MAKKGKYGHPGSSGQAQSGGINHTFGGGKGGTAASKKSTRNPVIGSTKLNNGLTATIRNEAGNNARVRQTGLIGMPPPITTGAADHKTRINVRKPHKGGAV